MEESSDAKAAEPQKESTAEELARLAAENEALKAKLDDAGKARKKGGFWRGFLVWVLIILACFFSLAGVLSTWVRATTLDTNTFVGTIAPLVKQEAVATAATDIAVKELFKAYQIPEKIKTGLNELNTVIQQNAPANVPIPDIDITFIAEPISGGLESVAKGAAKKILQSEAFYKVWEESLKLAHTTMVDIVRGNEDAAVTSRGDTVILNLGPLLTDVKKQLVDAGLGFLDKVPVPENLGEIELFTAKQLGTVKQMVNLLDLLYWLFPLLALIFFVLAVVAAKERRRALMWAGGALAVTMLLVLIVLKVTRGQLLGQISDKQILAAADVVWGSVLGGLKQAIWGIFALGLVVSVGAAVAGPYKWATWLREHVGDFFKTWRERRQGDEEKKGFYAFVEKYAWWIRGAGLVIAIIVLLFLPHVSALAIIITVIILAIYMAAVELLR